MRLIPLLSLMIFGCDQWPQNQTVHLDDALWDPSTVTLDDGVYAMLPRAGRLVRIGTDDNWDTVDLDGGRPISIKPDSNHDRLMVHVQWPVCEDSSSNIVLVEDCPEDALYWDAEMAIVNEGERKAVSSVPAHMNGMAFTPDGNTAIVYMDDSIESHVVTGPIVDLTEVMFLDLETGDTESLSIGFMPRNILFTKNGNRAVIMSRSQVMVIDMESRDVQIEYPLTLDADIEIDPSAAVLSPDDRYVLITIEGSSDLYKLDLEVVSIDMEALTGVPSDMASDPETGRTVLVYGNRAAADVIVEHDFIERQTLDLDEPATDIVIQDAVAVIYNTADNSSHDIVKIDLTDLQSTEYVTQNPVSSLKLSPSGDYAVAALRPQAEWDDGGLDGFQRSRWGLAVADLRGDGIVSLVLESEPVGLAVVAHSDAEYALLLLDGVEELIQVNLEEPGQYTTIELPSAPVGISSSPTGGLTIAHRSALGQISFLDPSTGDLQTTGGFATADFFSEDRLPRRDTE